MSHLPTPYLLMTVMAMTACTKPWTPTHEYTCPDGYAFTIAYSDPDNPGDIAIFEDADGTTKLPRAPSSSGTRYSNEATEFLRSGEEVTIKQAGTVMHNGCTTD